MTRNARPLPVRDGVGPSVIVLPDVPEGARPWATILDFLDEKFPGVDREEIVARMQRGDVCDAHGEPVPPNTPYQPQQKLYYYREIADEPKLPFEETIVFEDELLVVADKPHFLPVTPGGRFLQETLLVRLKRRLGIDTLAPMHRIDRETAGLVLFTKQPATRGAYQSLFEQRVVEKSYEAWASWSDHLHLPMVYRSYLEESEHFMRMREVPGREPNSETAIALIERRGVRARFQLSPLTGKKHQLRLHMAALGMPILNDQIYPLHATADEEDLTRPLQLLAKSIAFSDPITGQTREYASGLALAGPPPD
jgi:tRNA pseudouridine32 synthase / 23S rRNA pseudouridine746 synthase